MRIEAGHVAYALDPGIDRIGVFAEQPGRLLDIHVGAGNGAQGLDERAPCLRIRIDESANPLRRRRAHIIGAAMHQQCPDRQIGELHDAAFDAGKIQGDRRLMQGTGQKGRRRMIGAQAGQNGRTQHQ